MKKVKPRRAAEKSKPSETKPKKKKRKVISINLSGCRYNVVAESAAALGFSISKDKDDDKFNIWFQDMSVNLDRVMKLKTYQKINHFPGTLAICRKDELAINLNKLLHFFPDDYDFYPRTFILPRDSEAFRKSNAKKARTWIVKPQSGCQGKGIFLTKTPEKVSQTEPQVAQQYLSNPLLIDGHKFDLRVYVLVLSVTPLRIFLYKDGLARLCTEKYRKPKRSNIDNMCMHLTNYSINKNSDKFDDAEGDETR